MATNFFSGEFKDKNGNTVKKTVTSSSKSSTDLRKETIDRYKEKGYSYKSGSMGTKH